jgi:hypothetical protein
MSKAGYPDWSIPSTTPPGFKKNARRFGFAYAADRR